MRVVRVARNAVLTAMHEQRFRFTDQFLFLAGPDRASLRALVETRLERDLDDLVALAGRLRVRPAIGFVPDRLQIDPEALARRVALYRLSPVDVDYPNRLLRNALAARGIPFVDPTACLRRQGGGLYYRENHLTAAGHAALADCAAGELGPIVSPRP
jgi:hypothetical protein